MTSAALYDGRETRPRKKAPDVRGSNAFIGRPLREVKREMMDHHHLR